MRIFVVEDDAELLGFIVLLFLSDRRDVVALRDGQEASQMLAVTPPDVLVCDLGLPGLAGEEVARAAASLPHRPRIVLMSGELDRLERGGHLADALLPKPFTIRQLREAVGPLS